VVKDFREGAHESAPLLFLFRVPSTKHCGKLRSVTGLAAMAAAAAWRKWVAPPMELLVFSYW